MSNTEDLKIVQAHLGKQIRALRQARRLSQPSLAARCQVHVSHLSKVERGVANVTLQTLLAVANGLAVTLPDLFAATNVSAVMQAAVQTSDDRSPSGAANLMKVI
jgi:transcriptional regulator with XRE-family HTH domain